jgi:hypothetical protein
VAYDNNDKKMESVYSQRIKAGKRRTYFFDVRETRGNDYYLTITESRKKFNEDGYDRHKIFLYKEDFNKFLKGMTEAIDFVKTELMPDFDFDAFNHDNAENFEGNNGGAVKNISEHEDATTATAGNTNTDTPADAKTPEVEPGKEDTSEPSSDTASTSHHDEEVDKW